MASRRRVDVHAKSGRSRSMLAPNLPRSTPPRTKKAYGQQQMADGNALGAL